MCCAQTHLRLLSSTTQCFPHQRSFHLRWRVSAQVVNRCTVLCSGWVFDMALKVVELREESLCGITFGARACIETGVERIWCFLSFAPFLLCLCLQWFLGSRKKMWHYFCVSCAASVCWKGQTRPNESFTSYSARLPLYRHGKYIEVNTTDRRL